MHWNLSKFDYSIKYLIIIVLMVNFLAIPGKFVWDDILKVQEFSQTSLIKELKDNFLPVKTRQHFIIRPISNIWLYFEYKVFHNRAFLFRFTHLLLHILNTTFLFILLRQLLKDKQASFYIALIFGIHPLHGETLGFISQVPEILLFLVAALMFYFYLKNKYFLVIIFFILSLGIKEYAIFSLFALLLYEGIKRKRLYFDAKLLILLAISVLYILLQLKELNTSILLSNKKFTWANMFLTSFKLFNIYILNFFIPIKLKIRYIVSAFSSPLDFLFIVNFLITGAIFYFLFFRVKAREPKIFFVVFILLILPYITVFSYILGLPLADHLMYIPMVGLCGTAYYLFRKNRQILTIFISILIIIAIKQHIVWQSDESVWQTMIKQYPNIGYGYNQLIRHYVLYKNENAKAVEVADRIMKNKSLKDADAAEALAIFFLRNDSFVDRAEVLLDELLKKYPENNLFKILKIKILNRQGHFAQALERASALEQKGEDSSDLYYEKAQALNYSGRHKEAIDYYKKAINHAPMPQARFFFQIAMAYIKLKDYNNALYNFKRALKYYKSYQKREIEATKRNIQALEERIKREKISQ